MHSCARTTLAILCSLVIAVAIGCGGGPTKPSQSATGAVIRGTVTNASASAGNLSVARASGTARPADSPFTGLTVRIMGTNQSAVVDASGVFEISDVPTGTVKLQFSSDSINVTITINNVAADQFIEIQVQVSGSSAVVTDEERSGKVSLCHAEGNGSYHLIDVSESAEPAHRAHGDAKIGEPVPGHPTQTFDENCKPIGPEVDIEKFTNGEDADNAPGPEIPVGNAVTWTYVVKNTGTVSLTAVAVTDNKIGAVSCPQATLAAGASMTCTGTGVSVVGQYTNIGTVTASYTFNGNSGQVTDSDPSHYLGVNPEPEQDGGQKVTLCHRTGAGFFVMITVSIDAEPAHLAHGDGRPGGAVPNQAGKVFTSTCGVQ
jgi:hypothetical protein